MNDLAEALMYFVVFLLSTTLHEAAHAWTALRGGDPTAYRGGQVSLDPIPHIRREPFGMVVLPLLTALTTGWPLGFASAPYDPQWAMRFPRRAAIMALAGPAANFLLVLLAGGLILAGTFAGVFYAPDRVTFGDIVGTSLDGVWPAAASVLGAFFCVNLLLGIFNLLPLPPLDGSGAVPLLLSDQATQRYQQLLWSNPMLGWLGILIAWRVFDVLFDPIFVAAVSLLYPGASYS